MFIVDYEFPEDRLIKDEEGEDMDIGVTRGEGWRRRRQWTILHRGSFDWISSSMLSGHRGVGSVDDVLANE